MNIDTSIFGYLNNTYKSLLTRQRAYAAFVDEKKGNSDWSHKSIFTDLSQTQDVIFDPMAGYGTVMQYGIACNVNTVTAEINLPSHLWQLLNNPKYNTTLVSVINTLLSERPFPKTNERFEVSEELIGPIGLELLINLYQINLDIIRSTFNYDSIIIEKLALSLLMPFVMRLATVDRGDTIHVKEGGVAIFTQYLEHYIYYLQKILLPLLTKEQKSQLSFLHSEHENIYADSSCFDFGSYRFPSFFTSPPYPNGADYGKMFLPENYFLRKLEELGLISFQLIKAPIIGTNSIAGRRKEKIASRVANEFLFDYERTKLKKSQRQDLETYYLPYYHNYFSDIERAYNNISKYLSNDFLGYIVVTNNSVRRKEIPVSDFIIDFWVNHLKFNASSVKKRDLAHIGSKNPNVRSRTIAQYTEHVVMVWRGNVRHE